MVYLLVVFVISLCTVYKFHSWSDCPIRAHWQRTYFWALRPVRVPAAFYNGGHSGSGERRFTSLPELEGATSSANVSATGSILRASCADVHTTPVAVSTLNTVGFESTEVLVHGQTVTGSRSRLPHLVALLPPLIEDEDEGRSASLAAWRRS